MREIAELAEMAEIGDERAFIHGDLIRQWIVVDGVSMSTDDRRGRI